MKFFLYFLILLFFKTNYVVAKTEFWKCDHKSFKIVMPFIGFNKIYKDVNDLWVKVDKFEITDNEYILYDQKYQTNKKCSNKKCKVNFYISRVNTSGSFSDYISKVSNEFCEIDGSGICFKRSINKNLDRGYCTQIINVN